MKSAPFSVLCPRDLDELTNLLGRHSEDARILAGGQTLIPMLAMRVATPKILIDINQITNFPGVMRKGPYLEVGALVRHAELGRFMTAHPHHLLSQMAPWIAHTAIRNRGTVCGSICHADPSAEWVLALLMLDGYVDLISHKKKRRVNAKDFFVGSLQTSKSSEEIVTAVGFRFETDGVQYGFSEYGYRHGDFAIVSVAVMNQGRHWTVGFGGVADVPLVFDLHDGDKAEFLGFVERLSRELEIRGDPCATSEYRRFLMRTQSEQALNRLA